MIIEATTSHIPAMHVIRMAVKENALNDPELVKEKDYVDHLTGRGKGWVHVVDERVTGFAIVDMLEKNVWALFVDPEQEGKGIGRMLHDMMINWYFSKTDETLWLGTAPNTRAERFYRKAGWIDKGLRKNGEVYFEMTSNTWKEISSQRDVAR